MSNFKCYHITTIFVTVILILILCVFMFIDFTNTYPLNIFVYTTILAVLFFNLFVYRLICFHKVLNILKIILSDKPISIEELQDGLDLAGLTIVESSVTKDNTFTITKFDDKDNSSKK